MDMAKTKIRIVSWNVNGLRAVLKKQDGFVSSFGKLAPDVMFLEEIKLPYDDFALPQMRGLLEEYDAFVHTATNKKGYSGVMAFIRKGLFFDYEVKKGIGVPEIDIEGRVISVFVKQYKIMLVGAYFPNSQPERKRLEYKLFFGEKIIEYLSRYREEGWSVVISGDFNIAHKEIDLARPKDNENSPGFYIEERNWMSHFLYEHNYVDTFRLFTKEGGHYTWWSYRTRARERNVGWRIDYNVVSNDLQSKVLKSIHNTEIYGSDHCPVTIELMI